MPSPWHICCKSSPLPARPEKVSAGPEGRQDDVGREISSRHPVKFTWGTHLPPLNLPACVALACSCSSARRHCHSSHSHQSPCRRGRDLRLQGSSPCMGRSSSAAFAQRAGLRDHHTIGQKNACSKRLPCLKFGDQAWVGHVSSFRAPTWDPTLEPGELSLPLQSFTQAHPCRWPKVSLSTILFIQLYSIFFLGTFLKKNTRIFRNIGGV